MATAKQIATARKNLKKARAAKKSARPYRIPKPPTRLKHKGRIRPLLDKVTTLI